MGNQMDVANSDSSQGGGPISPVPVSIKSLPPFLSIEQVSQHIIPVSPKIIRHWIFNNTDNFDKECCTRRGRRVFIVKDSLVRWMERGR